MTQKRDIFRSKTTFAWIQFQVHFPEFAKDSIQVLKVPFPIFVVYIEIVNKYLQEFVPSSLKTVDIVRVKVLVPFLRPNGMTVQSYNPVLVINVVFFMSSGAIRICQKPDCKSNAVN